MKAATIEPPIIAASRAERTDLVDMERSSNLLFTAIIEEVGKQSANIIAVTTFPALRKDNVASMLLENAHFENARIRARRSNFLGRASPFHVDEMVNEEFFTPPFS